MIDRRFACLGLAAGLLAGTAGRSAAQMSNDEYAAAVQQRLDQIAARQKLGGRKLEGIAVISFQVDSDGRLRWHKVEKTGNPELDTLALRIVDAAAPFPPLPAALKDHVWVWLLSLDPSLSMVRGAGPNG